MKYLSLAFVIIFSLNTFAQSILLKGGMVHSGTGASAKIQDILISGSDSKKLYRIAKKHMTGIGISKNFIHMDALTPEEAPRPTVWRYS